MFKGTKEVLPNKSSGFTLIELLIVITIIALLAGAALFIWSKVWPGVFNLVFYQLIWANIWLLIPAILCGFVGLAIFAAGDQESDDSKRKLGTVLGGVAVMFLVGAIVPNEYQPESKLAAAMVVAVKPTSPEQKPEDAKAELLRLKTLARELIEGIERLEGKLEPKPE